MARTGRYVFTPAGRASWQRRTIRDRIHYWIRKRSEEQPDVFIVTGYWQPVMPSAGFRHKK